MLRVRELERVMRAVCTCRLITLTMCSAAAVKLHSSYMHFVLLLMKDEKEDETL